jgi:hypothetical protein
MGKDYVGDYLKAYRQMKKAAITKMKEYGKTLEVVEVCKQNIMKHFGYKSAAEIHDDELQDCLDNNAYSCVFVDKHGFLYDCQIIMVRYNEQMDDVDAYIESREGDIAGWYQSHSIWEQEGIYMTVHEFIV